MKNLRAGLVGVGMMGRHHARVLGSLDGVELVAVVDPGGDPHGVANGRELLASVGELIARGVDYAMVAAPTALHEAIGLELAEAGIHALIKNPWLRIRQRQSDLPQHLPRAVLWVLSGTLNVTTPRYNKC